VVHFPELREVTQIQRFSCMFTDTTMMNCMRCTVSAIFFVVMMSQGSFSFSPQRTTKSSAPLILQPARIVPSTRFVSNAKAFRMTSSSDSEEPSTDKKAAPTSGTFYDDEVIGIDLCFSVVSMSINLTVYLFL
jgi:hypothetical protein